MPNRNLETRAWAATQKTTESSKRICNEALAARICHWLITLWFGIVETVVARTETRRYQCLTTLNNKVRSVVRIYCHELLSLFVLLGSSGLNSKRAKAEVGKQHVKKLIRNFQPDWLGSHSCIGVSKQVKDLRKNEAPDTFYELKRPGRSSWSHTRPSRSPARSLPLICKIEHVNKRKHVLLTRILCRENTTHIVTSYNVTLHPGHDWMKTNGINRPVLASHRKAQVMQYNDAFFEVKQTLLVLNQHSFGSILP